MTHISHTERLATWRRYFAALLLTAAVFALAGPVAAQPSGPGDLPNPDEEVDPGLDNPPVSVDDLQPDVVDDGDRAIQIVEVDNSAYPMVDIIVSVPPAFAGELPANAFGLTENASVRTAQVVKLREPIEVVVVIDTSGSMGGEPIAAAKAAAKQFIESLDGDTGVAVVGFGPEATTVASFADDRADALAAVDALEAQGETALYDALTVASAEFANGDARRFVIVLSDGNDTASAATLQDAVDALGTGDVTFYAITLVSDDADFSGLINITGQVEGQVLEATDESLDEVYTAVGSRISNLYKLTYESRVTGTAPVVISLDIGGEIAVAAQEITLAPAPGSSGGAGSGPRPAASGDVTVVTEPEVTGLLNSNTAIYIGAGAFFLAIGGFMFMVFSREKSGPSAFQRLNIADTVQRRGGLANVTDRATGLADRLLAKGERRGALDAVLEKAGLEMRPGEFVVAAIGAALGVGALGFVLNGPIFGLAGLGVGLLGSRMWVSLKASKRQKMFGEQLGDTLMMIAGSMRAGHGIVEAIDTVASQAPSPTGDEFSRAVAEARIGRDMVESLYDIAERTESEDFIWVVRAISINRELGGDLAEILDNVGETIRDRNRLRDQVKALSAEGKVSAMILFALPVLVAVWVRISNPEYMNDMLDETAGKIMMGMAVLSLLTGGLWLKKLVNVEF